MYRTEPIFFFDEIQEVQGWEKFVNRMYEQGRKVYVTGSNARLLSSEISTSLTGSQQIINRQNAANPEAEALRHHEQSTCKNSLPKTEVKKRQKQKCKAQAIYQLSELPI